MGTWVLLRGRGRPLYIFGYAPSQFMRFVYDAGIFDLFFLMSGEFYDEKNNGIFLRGLAAGLGFFFRCCLFFGAYH